MDYDVRHVEFITDMYYYGLNGLVGLVDFIPDMLNFLNFYNGHVELWNNYSPL